jgi:copper homeostasis protein
MKYELCAASLEAIRLAKELNFDRIELCQNLEQGGITPSYGMIEYAIAHGIDTHVLVRPRPGGFFYTEEEMEVMLREIINCKEIGAKGVVVGVLNESGEIDKERLAKIVEKADGMEVTFHRAFDDCLDWKKAMDILIELGVHRILSSGMARNVEHGLPILEKMKAYSNGRIEIMAGGGISAANVGKVCQQLGPDAIHFSGTVKFLQDEESLFSESVLKVDAARVKRILGAVVKCG